jgi:hypothetical protein
VRRPLRSLILLLLPAFVLLSLQCFFIISLFVIPGPLREAFVFMHIVVTALLAVLFVPFFWRFRWLWRFCRQVRRFGTIENSRIVLHYEPELEGREAFPLLLLTCRTELDSLTRLFGSPLRRRVKVFFFARWQDVAAIVGPGCGGLAISQGNVIVIARDNCVPESMRHELAHLFSSRWNVFAPPLLSEGLSVSLQGTVWGQPIDSAALSLLRQGGLRLSSLLQSKFFFAEPRRHSCYTLAGSFTGFLIRRYGWARYRKLYRRCSGFRFRATFQKCIGISLERAEWQWRNEVMVMPILNRRLGRKPHC